ncbi:hypothetical protein [Sphingomonas cavernae]|uniref:Uncharacterized protein n=1 Tax=Sphingomonas cavernae TaxID=2320861 RepID=A0A418W7N9_9SPHN|nr:hypothetical protein [Sphingomonas cavernae]RJF86011.1 hypothetical protein D3876_19450 [Sphingomonas cavernae]
MKVRYRVIHQRKSAIAALLSGRGYTDWYIAQRKRLFGWAPLGTYPSLEEAEAACDQHAGGKLLPGGGHVVAEFVRLDED